MSKKEIKVGDTIKFHRTYNDKLEEWDGRFGVSDDSIYELEVKNIKKVEVKLV